MIYYILIFFSLLFSSALFWSVGRESHHLTQGASRPLYLLGQKLFACLFLANVDVRRGSNDNEWHWNSMMHQISSNHSVIQSDSKWFKATPQSLQGRLSHRYDASHLRKTQRRGRIHTTWNALDALQLSSNSAYFSTILKTVGGVAIPHLRHQTLVPKHSNITAHVFIKYRCGG
jgi:hypothetical protein